MSGPASGPEGTTGRDRPRRHRPGGRTGTGDRIFRLLTVAFATGALLLPVAMAVDMTMTAEPVLRSFGLAFATGSDWDPVRGLFGALPFIFGTVVSSFLALLVAVPVSLGAAIFLSELAPGWLREPAGLVIELLAAIPSVVYGLWGIFVLVPWLRETVQPELAQVSGFLPLFGGVPRGVGMMAGGLILAIMILPTIASVSRDVMRAVPAGCRESALALGATHREMILMAVLPCAFPGIIGAIVLGLGRALGETMAVTMVIGNRAGISVSLFDPAATMASVIANEYAEASDDLHLAALSGIGLLLFAVTVILNIIARLLVWRVARGSGAAGRT